jgi:hypothetical protein
MATIRQGPGQLDIALVYGDDFTFPIRSSIDLSGYTLAAKCGSVTFAVTATPGMPVGYYYNITITAAQSAAFTADNLVWTFTWVDPNTKKRTAAAGIIRRIVPGSGS